MIVQLFAFEPASAVWVLLAIPVLEAGLIARLRGALTIWTIAVGTLLLREVLAVQLHHLPAPSPQPPAPSPQPPAPSPQGLVTGDPQRLCG